MAYKIVKIILYLFVTLIVLYGVFYLFNGGITNIIATTKADGFWTVIEDLFVGIFKGFTRTLGLN